MTQDADDAVFAGVEKVGIVENISSNEKSLGYVRYKNSKYFLRDCFDKTYRRTSKIRFEQCIIHTYRSIRFLLILVRTES